MLCEKCGQREATVLYTQIINGHKQTLNLCRECAGQDSGFANFGSLFGFGTPGGYTERRTQRCPVCGMTLAEFSKTGKMGCGECYRTFRTQAIPLLKKIHGSTKHISAEPIKKAEESRAESLREQMRQAVECEDFETAARLRDEIRKISEEGDK